MEGQRGQTQEKTEYARIVVWAKLAEVCNQYLEKGREVFLEGKLQTRKYQDKNGAEKYVTEIVAENVQFIGGGQAQGQQQGQSQQAPAAAPQKPFQGQQNNGNQQFQKQRQSEPQADLPMYTSEDIPF